ncbi:hypothetical protein GIB67_014716 [Kingdonia uniflora]|uniref:Uncharacterized protein n=1 Tax=Kingdonia uniflora TaxID=39325 RepID=A0A7J7NUQ9_9MAGN|nr:hypothetical protein GIB67_014716 [Kingdonia uniflora]
MVKTRSQRAVEARALNDLRLALEIDEIREVIFGQQGYDAVLLETRANYEGMTDVERGEEINRVYWSESMRICWRSVEDRKEFIMMMAREEIINEDKDITSGLLKACGLKGTPVASNASILEIGVIDCFLPKRYDMPDRFRRADGLVQESRTVYSKTQNRQRFGEMCIRGKDKRKIVSRSLYCEQREEAEIEEVLKKLQKLSKLVWTNAVDSHSGVGAQFDYGLALPLSNLAKSVMNMIGACPVQLNYNFWEVILVCETLNERWAASGSVSRIAAQDFFKYYAVKFVTTTSGAYLSSRSSRPCFFDLSSAGRVWNDNLLWVSGECNKGSKVLRKESYIDSVAMEGIELEVILKKIGINRFKRVASKDDKVRRSQAKRRMAGKTSGSMEENMLTLELNTPLKLAWLNEMPDGPVDMATVSSTVVRNLAKGKAVKRGVVSRFATSDSVDDSSKRKKVTPPAMSQVVLEESVKIAKGADLRPHFEVKTGLMEEQCRAKVREKGVTVVEDEFKKLELEKEREAAALKLKEVKAESVAEAEETLPAEVYKGEDFVFSKGNYEEKEIVDEEEVEEMGDGLNVAKKTVADNQETIDQLSLKLKEAKSQVKDKTTTLLSKDLALNQLISELAELKERAASGSRHDAELAEYRIRALNNEISDMKCNIRALNEQLLKREIDLDTARTNLAVSEADFEKFSSSIMGKDLELRNSAQIRDSLIARLDHLKANLRRLKEREAKSRADLAEVQAKNKSMVDDLAHVHGNVMRAVQSDKEMNGRINQLCAQITELERELRAWEM